MTTKVLSIYGIEEALLGISLYRGGDISTANRTALKLLKADLNSGELKYLESIIVYLDINAPRYWWQQFDTYRVGVSKQSSSTMYGLTREPFKDEDFEGGVDPRMLEVLNELLDKECGPIQIKGHLPESYLQRRIVRITLKTLYNIINQRKNHALIQWQNFCVEINDKVIDLVLNKLAMNDRTPYRNTDEA